MSARKVGLNAVIYGLGGMLNRLISFLLLPLFTNYLTEADFGRAGMLQILSVFLVAVFSAGIGGSLSSCYFKQESGEGKRTAVATGILMLLVSCGLMLAVLLPASPLLAGALLKSSGWTDLMVYSLVTTALSILAQPFVLCLQFEQRSRLFVKLSAISTVLTALCNIAAVAWLQMGLRGWVISQMIGQAISIALYAGVYFKEGGWHPQRKFMRELLLLGLPVVPTFAGMYVMQQGNRYAVEYFYGLDSLGVYVLALNLATVSSLAVSSFQTSWAPYFLAFRNRQEEARAAFGRIATYYGYFMGLAAVCFFAFAQPVVELMADAKFHEAWLAVGAAALANVILGATALLTPAQYFSDKLGHLTVMNAIAAVLSVGINAGLIYWAGPSAAGFALALSYGCLLLIHGWWNHRGLSMKLPVCYEWGRLAAVAVAVAVSAVVYLVFPAGSILSGCLRGVAGPLLFCVLVWILLTPQQRGTALGMARRLLPKRRVPVSDP